MGEQDIRTAFQKARTCIARISICRPRLPEADRFMVIPGIIVSVENGVARIVCNSQFFENYRTFTVSFPNAGGYEEAITVLTASVHYEGEFARFDLELRNVGFVQSANFETRALKSGDLVDALSFPRKGFNTPAAYSGGYIEYGPDGADEIEVAFQDCAVHEYAYMGSPLFNRNGDIVGVTFGDVGILIAYNVVQMRHLVLDNLDGIAYVLDGHPVE